MVSVVSQLSQIISKAVATLEMTCQAKGTQLPDIDAPFTPHSDSFRNEAAAAEASDLIVAAALQLIATVQPPHGYIGALANGHLKSAAIRVCLEANVAEILREAGPEGLYAEKIAEKAKLDSKKLVRLLRLLATHHVFREVEPDVFANNRISSILDTGKSVKELTENPEERHKGAGAYAALLEFLIDEGSKSSAYLLETLQDPIMGPSEEPNHAPLNRAFNCDVPYWDWIEQPGQERRLQRFGTAMRGAAASQSTDQLLQGFKWDALTENDLVVDVGGGFGQSSMAIARAVPAFKIIVQDRAQVISRAKEVWKAQFPEAIEQGRVTLQAHDFFTAQRVTNATVFLLNKIIHDWSDMYAVKILSHLRAAATPKTKLLLVEPCVPYACHDPASQDPDAIPGAAIQEAPSPLLVNMGGARDLPYTSDMIMMVLNNSQERTLGHYKDLLGSAGWRIVRVYRTDNASFFQQTEAVPV